MNGLCTDSRENTQTANQPEAKIQAKVLSEALEEIQTLKQAGNQSKTKENKREKIGVMPNLGDYYTPIKILVERCLQIKLIKCPPTTKRTVELGAKNSPDTVCTPYKITLGNFIEALKDTKANVLIMPGIACRLGLYDVLQKQALTDMGYDFEMIVLFDFIANKSRLYRNLAAYNTKLTEEEFNAVMATVARVVLDMDEFAANLRANKAFEINKGELENAYNSYLKEAEAVRDEAEAERLGQKYREKVRLVRLNKPINPIRIGLIGDLYSVMEPHGNCHIEKWLSGRGVEIIRPLDLTFCARSMSNSNGLNELLQKSIGYTDYHIGGVANCTIAMAGELTGGAGSMGAGNSADGLSGGTDAGNGTDGLRAAEGVKLVDGLIHMKAASCSPEITAMSILQNISRDRGVPIIYLTFDTETGEAGLQTRLEAFLDMLTLKKEAEGEK